MKNSLYVESLSKINNLINIISNYSYIKIEDI